MVFVYWIIYRDSFTFIVHLVQLLPGYGTSFGGAPLDMPTDTDIPSWDESIMDSTWK